MVKVRAERVIAASSERADDVAPHLKARPGGESRGVDPRTGLSPMAHEVYTGLESKPKRLPSYLFYDTVGSALYEKITKLPEYYPTRTENQILTHYATEIIELARCEGETLTVAELGAGTSSKTVVILRALVEQQGECVYIPTDVSTSALELGAARIGDLLPQVEIEPCIGLHEQAFKAIQKVRGHRLVMFIGSSIGNYGDAQAIELLSGLRDHVDVGCYLLLGTDMKKSESVLLPAYDDSQGITAQFNKNALSHLNRELQAEFDLSRFHHVALWNEAESRIEMHLQSTEDQVVPVRALGLRVPFLKGERIHTESSVKYDSARVDQMLSRSGFERIRTFTDSRQWFGVHLARAV